MSELEALLLHPWSLSKAIKFLGLAAYTVGISATVISEDRVVRLRALYGLVVPGFVLTYAAGWMLMKLSGRSLLAPWLIAGAVVGWFSLHLAFMSAYRARPRRVTPMLAWGFLGAGISIMTLRVETLGSVVPIAVIGLGAGSLAAWPFTRTSALTSQEDEDTAWRGLRWLTLLEGTTLLLLVGVSMPLRALFDVRLDGGTGLLGWVHGVLVLVFIQSLASSCRLFDWSRGTLFIGAGSALVPGGGFWLHRHLRRKVNALGETSSRRSESATSGAE